MKGASMKDQSIMLVAEEKSFIDLKGSWELSSASSNEDLEELIFIVEVDEFELDCFRTGSPEMGIFAEWRITSLRSVSG